MKTFKIFTFGCKVNQYESQQIREEYCRLGYREAGNRIPADIYIINTCTVTARADADSLSSIRRAHRENPAALVYVAGCLIKNDRAKIREMLPRVRFLEKNDLTRGIAGLQGHTRAFIKIQDGCVNTCSYCKVRLVRNTLKSRAAADILHEARILVAAGYKELVLCGICLGAYGKDRSDRASLAMLLEKLKVLDGDFRIRLSSIEFADVTQQLIAQFESNRRLCPHAHIPLQSGDDTILKSMRRRYTARDYAALITELKKRIPKVSITTDVMVGFPGETEENFCNTITVLKEIEPLRVHIFPYSPRPGTAAFAMRALEVPCHVVNERVHRLSHVARDVSYRFRKRFVGKILDVLPEEHGGYTQNYIPVTFTAGFVHPNTFMKAKITRVTKENTFARVVIV